MSHVRDKYKCWRHNVIQGGKPIFLRQGGEGAKDLPGPRQHSDDSMRCRKCELLDHVIIVTYQIVVSSCLYGATVPISVM